MSPTQHRPAPEPPQPSTVVAEPATPETVTADWADRTGTASPHPSSYSATPHTLGRR